MDMIERVARAMERARNPQWTDEQFETWWNVDPFFCEKRTSWGHFTGTRKGHCMFEARSAIAEMREPTEKMRDRYNDPDIVGYGPDGSDHDKVWQAGIDAILSEIEP